MKIHQHIMAHTSNLENHEFIYFLKHAKIASQQTLAFIPRMTFFVLGFKDILEASRVANPQTSLDDDINTHCEEDSEHWLWFLQDLEHLAKLGLEASFSSKDSSALLQAVWSEDTYRVRSHTYRVVSHVINAKSTEEKLIIIDCLEAAFSVFINGLNQLTQRSGLYRKLRYFGEEHHVDEASHTLGSWVEGERSKQNSGEEALTPFRQKQMIAIIDDVFAGFDEVFTCWSEAVAVKEAIAV